MKAKYKIHEDVYYKRFLETTGNVANEYIVRKGTVLDIRLQSSRCIPRYTVATLGTGVSFVLLEDEVYATQEEVLRSIK